MCEHSYEYKGYRSFGADVPDLMQGCFYPGDEPGLRCRLTDEPCDPDECPLNSKGEEDGLQ